MSNNLKFINLCMKNLKQIVLILIFNKPIKIYCKGLINILDKNVGRLHHTNSRTLNRSKY